MPELPEVEVTMQEISPLLMGATIEGVWSSGKDLREPIGPGVMALVGARVLRVSRRAKFIVVETSQGILLMHLGMSGHMRMPGRGEERERHDHFELQLKDRHSLRLNDTRRFGLVRYFRDLGELGAYPAFAALGPEPLGEGFTPRTLHAALRRRHLPIKQAIMDSKVVVGVGNIYASESLFAARLDPRRPASSLTPIECGRLCAAIKRILAEAIRNNGTTFDSFSDALGDIGHYVEQLRVYGRRGRACPNCGRAIESVTLGGRSTFFCPACQR
ncbi:MAG: bifunctional DNA-formamidopyrimidine glycosylase/DNA-(apurinic or apyrimidinic site) lyase [Succinivibrionaceae bacterium]|nr:bifunctional DNA-formamidopyrimidine glycosylase/DNA-(apurinic or apyrimidinic site) lyase [Succinivibrionaceae bacterium]